jgi:predicted nucleic acid-binding protein
LHPTRCSAKAIVNSDRTPITKHGARYVGTLATVADVQPDPAPGPAVTRDPDDDYVIHLARAHDADLVVSGDADLLEWDEQDPPVIPPAEFEARLSQT